MWCGPRCTFLESVPLLYPLDPGPFELFAFYLAYYATVVLLGLFSIGYEGYGRLKLPSRGTASNFCFWLVSTLFSGTISSGFLDKTLALEACFECLFADVNFDCPLLGVECSIYTG